MSVGVVLPDALVRRVELLIEDSGMRVSVGDFVAMCVRDCLGRADLKDAGPLSVEDEEKVKARLKALGYID